MGRSIVKTFRLRPGRDTDILNALDGIPKNVDRSDEIRKALRAYFRLDSIFISTNTENAFKGITPAVALILNDEVILQQKEKSAEELNGALDNLLNDF